MWVSIFFQVYHFHQTAVITIMTCMLRSQIVPKASELIDEFKIHNVCGRNVGADQRCHYIFVAVSKPQKLLLKVK